MSAISDYGSLLIDACEYAGRNDVAHIFSRFVGLAEAKFNRLLRVGDMEKTADLVLTDGNADLPDDFLEVRSILAPNGSTLSAWSLTELQDRYRGFSGYPSGYAVVGNVLQARPAGSATLPMSYYAKIPPLTPAAPTNWLLEKAPDAYLYGVVEEIGIFGQNAELVAGARALKQDAIRGLKLNDERSRWANSQFVVGAYTP
ncbi:hypothetical protein DEM27_05700 [Metarhizobium album]|uniref:Uncharacterized protein n=1 Tax=Metarhizobium album TaxID=2182425 RepID=A0A2U2DV07_9HYPH|nr:hypothetical protein [Rhizobium album]PWE57134.1 hypothetical protein DEM27_05700 [Rhizobium album]